MTLWANLKTQLKSEDDDKKPTRTKKQKHKGGQGGQTFLMCVEPKDPKETQSKNSMTLLGAPPKEQQHPLHVSWKLPFIDFPIGDGRTSDNSVNLSGLSDTGGCCNMGWLTCHKAVPTNTPNLLKSSLL
jgi:hypothetical protein